MSKSTQPATVKRIFPTKKFGGIPNLDKFIVRPEDNRNPANRFLVNKEPYRNLTEARQAVITWKGIASDIQLHTVVDYCPGTGHKKSATTTPRKVNAKKMTPEQVKELQVLPEMAEVHRIRKSAPKTDVAHNAPFTPTPAAELESRYNLTINNHFKFGVNTTADLETVIGLIKKHKL